MENFEIVKVDDVYIIVAHLICPTYLESNEFKEAVYLQLGLGHKKLVVDISLCEHIDSTFIGAIINSFRAVTSDGGKLRLVKPVKSEVNIFQLTNTLSVLDFYRTREDAIKSFENDFQPKS